MARRTLSVSGSFETCFCANSSSWPTRNVDSALSASDSLLPRVELDSVSPSKGAPKATSQPKKRPCSSTSGGAAWRNDARRGDDRSGRDVADGFQDLRDR